MLGASFPRQAIEAVSDIDPAMLDELLSSLVRKEVLTVRADKLSPERGQYAFTQSLIRSVAYDMLTRAERKARHLRTAEHLRTAFPDEGAEVAEVIAAHLYDAYQAASDDPDADELRARACRAYVQAAERAESVGAPEAAESAYLRAAELSSDEAEQAGFTERAGRMAQLAGWNERAVGHFETAIAAHAEAGRVVDAARVTARLGRRSSALGRGEQAITRIREALASLEGTDAPRGRRRSSVEARGRSRLLRPRRRGDRADRGGAHPGPALRARRAARRQPQLEGELLTIAGRCRGGPRALRGPGVRRPRTRDHPSEMVAEGNLGDLCMTRDLPGAEEHAEAALALARRWGLREHEAVAAGNLMYILTMAGRFDEAHQLGTELLQAGGDERPGADEINYQLAYLEALRGNVDAAREHLAVCELWAESDDVQDEDLAPGAEAAVLLAEGVQPSPPSRPPAARSTRPCAEVSASRTKRSGSPSPSLSRRRSTSATSTKPSGSPSCWRAAREARSPRSSGRRSSAPRHLSPAHEVRTRTWSRTSPAPRRRFATSATRTGRHVPSSTGRSGSPARTGPMSRRSSPSEAAATFETIGAAPMLARARACVAPEPGRAIGAVLQVRS